MSRKRTIRLLPIQTRSAYTTKYHAVTHSAWLAHAPRVGLDVANRGAEEHWRRSELSEQYGVESCLDLDTTKEFDGAMLHFAMIAGNDRLIDKYSSGDERRSRHVIQKQLETISQIEQREVTWDYVRSIAIRMHLPESLEDCPAEHLIELSRRLDIHIRRHHEAPVHLPPTDDDLPF